MTVASLVAEGRLLSQVAPDETAVAGAMRDAQRLLLEASVASGGIVVLSYASQAVQTALTAAAAHGGLTVHSADGASEAQLDAALATAATAALPIAVEPAVAALAELRAAWAASLVPPVGEVDEVRALELATLAVATVETALDAAA